MDYLALFKQFCSKLFDQDPIRFFAYFLGYFVLLILSFFWLWNHGHFRLFLDFENCHRLHYLENLLEFAGIWLQLF